MKKVVLGSAVLLAGLLGAMLLLTAAMGSQWMALGQFDAFDILERYGLAPVFWLLLGAAAAGLVLAGLGLWERKK